MLAGRGGGRRGPFGGRGRGLFAGRGRGGAARAPDPRLALLRHFAGTKSAAEEEPPPDFGALLREAEVGVSVGRARGDDGGALEALATAVVRADWTKGKVPQNWTKGMAPNPPGSKVKHSWLKRTDAEAAAADEAREPGVLDRGGPRDRGVLGPLAGSGAGAIEVDRARAVLEAAAALLRPPGKFDLQQNPATFDLRAAEREGGAPLAPAQDWSTVTNLFRSGAGLTGVYFVDCGPQGVVVIKRVADNDEAQNDILMHALKKSMAIPVPEMAFVPAQSAPQSEFRAIEAGLRRAYEPYHLRAWECATGGVAPSPMADGFFDARRSHSIKLMELLKGAEPLSLQRGESRQRDLLEADFRCLGRVLLFDAIVRNTDRFPIRRFFYPNNQPGNPGNVMCSPACSLSGQPGELFAIDELSSLLEPGHDLAEHKKLVRSVMDDVCGAFAAERSAVVEMWVGVVHLAGETDTSLEKLNWEAQGVGEALLEGVRAHLGAIRDAVRAIQAKECEARGGAAAPRPEVYWCEIDVPAADSRIEWLRWSALALPRSLYDVAGFIQESTAITVGRQSRDAMAAGFKDAMVAVADTHEALQQAWGADEELSHSAFVQHAAQVMELVSEESKRLGQLQAGHGVGNGLLARSRWKAAGRMVSLRGSAGAPAKSEFLALVALAKKKKQENAHLLASRSGQGGPKGLRTRTCGV